MSSAHHRLPHVDALKALAALCIVLHHLASYGPISRAMHRLLPGLTEALYDHGRLAVQVFLVAGGFLSARALSPRGQALEASIPQALFKRYLRLVLPFGAALLLTLAVSLIVAPAVPDMVDLSKVSLPQWLAHLTLTQDLLGYESLTVGAWYVAVDLQLFALLLALLWLARCCGQGPWQARLGPVLVLGLALAAAWFFNLDATLDTTGLYFFAAYGLGACVHFMQARSLRPWLFGALLVLMVAALDFHWRDRLALALATAMWLALGPTARWLERLPVNWARRGNESYALFLVHFPVLLLVNGGVAVLEAPDAVALAAAGVSVWLSLSLAGPFHRWVELRGGRWLAGQVADSGRALRWLRLR
jgi:peptidoglycan/LPS O-acetylase OafA/YrhL